MILFSKYAPKKLISHENLKIQPSIVIDFFNIKFYVYDETFSSLNLSTLVIIDVIGQFLFIDYLFLTPNAPLSGKIILNALFFPTGFFSMSIAV